MERFTYNIKRSKLHNLGSDALKTLLLNAIKDEWIDLLNLVGKGDVYRFSFQEICELCKNISRGNEKCVRSPQDPFMVKVSKSASGLVSQTKPNNLLNILGNLNEQTDMLRMQNKQKVASFIFFPKCRKKHALHECPLDNIKSVKFVQDHILLKIAHHYQG